MRPPFAAICLSIVCIHAVLHAQADPSTKVPGPTLVPTTLRCDYRVAPLGIDSPQPRLDWILSTNNPPTRGLIQSAYQILVASSPELLSKDQGDIWDTGKLASNQMSQIDYGGKSLLPAQSVWWKVRVWDQADKASSWSEASHWTMGLLTEADWKGAKWIGDVFPSPSTSLGYHAAIAKRADEVKWVQVDLGKSQPLASVRLYPAHNARKSGFGFPFQFTIEASNDPDFKTSTPIIDQATVVNGPGDNLVPFDCPLATTARYVRVTTHKLPEERPGEFCFALRQIEVISGGKNIAGNVTVTAQDSVEAYGWNKASLTDGFVSAVTTDRNAGPVPTPNGTTRLQRKFGVKPGLERALIFVCGLGQQEIYLDGRKVGDDLFEPGYTDYRKTCFYETYDITDQLKQGAFHQIEVLLGNGFYNVAPAPGRYTKFTHSFGPRKAIALLRFEYADGSSDEVVTDESWKTAPGATTFANVYAGEDDDARLDAAAATTWAPAIVLPPPAGRLSGTSNAAPPVRADETFKPVAVKEIKPGLSVYDFGQNATMVPSLVASGPAGSIVRMMPSEIVNADGTINRVTCTQDGVRPAWWQYTLAGTGEESFFPKFFWHGYRYLQVEVIPVTPGGELPVVKSLESRAVHSSSPLAGEFSCSNSLFNQIYSLVRWAQHNNMGSVLSDCPHRERLGWLEEDHLNGPALRYDFDMNALYNKIEHDMADDQETGGLVPDFVPEYTRLSGAFRDSSEWGSSIILVPWQQYQFAGDRQLLSQYYEPMKRYLNFLKNKAHDNIIGGGLGDWYDLGPKTPGKAQLTPIENTDTCFYFYDAKVFSEIARILGKNDDAKEYSELANDIRTSFNQKFFKADTGQYSTGSEGSNAVPYVIGIVEPEHRESVLNGIVEDLKKNGNSFTTGEVTYRYLLRGLADAGRSALVFDINNQSEKPGYGMQIKLGCTSLAERWDAKPTTWSSLDHFMSGQIVEWLYHDLAGIQADESAPAFQKIIIKPAIVGDISWVKSSYDSIQGRIVSEWKRDGQSLSLHVSIPVNTTATVSIPAQDAGTVTETGKPASQADGVKFIKMDDSRVVYAVGSGDYTFASSLPINTGK